MKRFGFLKNEKLHFRNFFHKKLNFKPLFRLERLTWANWQPQPLLKAKLTVHNSLQKGWCSAPFCLRQTKFSHVKKRADLVAMLLTASRKRESVCVCVREREREREALSRPLTCNLWAWKHFKDHQEKDSNKVFPKIINLFYYSKNKFFLRSFLEAWEI